MPAISPARRLVRLQARRGYRWQTIAAARTDAAGRVRWSVRPRRSQQLRVRYLGATDLTSASSRLVRVVPKRVPTRHLAGRRR